MGELDPELVTGGAAGELFDGTELCGLKLEGALASASTESAEALPIEAGRVDVVMGSACDGDADNDGVLKGMKETEGLLPTFGTPSVERSDDLDPCIEGLLPGCFAG